MTTRAQFVAEARSHIGEPWLHQGRTRAGLDCLGLVLLTARALGLTEIDFTGYSMANNPQLLFDACDEHMERIALKDAQVADVVAISYHGVPHHLAILGDYQHGGLSLIHALNLWDRKVVEHGLDDGWRRRIVRAYHVPGVA